MNASIRVLLVLVWSLFAIRAAAQYPAQCDTRKECVGNAVSLTVSSGRTAHFIEISGYPTQPRQQALTVEMWINIERQAGKRQFLGGLWGPNKDYNDQWVFYIDEADRLTFEVNADATTLDQADNTIARASASGLYGRWAHVAAVFDGGAATVTLYIDGVVAAGPISNPQYPATFLKPLERQDLTTHIGSCNGLADNENLNRTMKGPVDEIRIWNRALAATEVLCQKDRSLNGNEAGLQVYYRCNEPVDNILQLCDATGKQHVGLLRSGAKNERSNRTPPRTVTVIPSTITEDINCDSTRTWTFTVTDTSICGSSATAVVAGPEASLFTVTPRNIQLLPGQPVVVTVVYTGTNVGYFENNFEIRPGNRCGQVVRVAMKLKRNTEISVSRSSIVFDTLFVGCKETTSIDSSITICNTSDKVGQPRTITLTNVLNNEPLGYRIINATFPMQLAPGQCTTLVVRSFVRDTTNDYLDTLQIFSDDRCQRTPARIALSGRTQEVISIRSTDGSRRIDTMRFSPTCPDLASSPQYYTWQNLTLGTLTIDTIIVPQDFTHYRIGFPFPLMPATGYDPIAIRFRPRSPGIKFDSVVIRTRIQGCTIERVIYVTGRGLDNKVSWQVNGVVDAGSVIVGQQRTINVVAKNTSLFDTLNVSLYVERGEAFALLAGTGRRIPPGDSVTIPVTFRPTDSLEYLDRLCLFETRCYTVDCIDLKGKGILRTYRFSPIVMETENVVACDSRDDTVHVVNITNQAQTMTDVVFADQSGGRITVISPPLPWTTYTIAAEDSLAFIFRYTPNDVTQDRADRAYIRYKSVGADWQVQLIATSATPKLFVTQFTAFGTVEVGDRRQLTLIVENTSALKVKVDSLTLGPGFTIVSTSRPIPVELDPRDSIAVVVEFAPTAAQNYNADLTAHSATPCTIEGAGNLQGRGVILELENAISLINFGYVRPCECSERIMPLLNASLVHPMTVDSLWIDNGGTASYTPQFYAWRSKFSPSGTFPYEIPPNTRDTVYLTFCPRSPAVDTATTCQAIAHVAAHGPGWARTTETFLAGKRSLTFAPVPTLVQFAPGPVDVLSTTPLRVTVGIPDFTVNPTQDTVVIDSITFVPDDRVFFITSPVAGAMPVTIRPGENLQIDVRQRPRAPRLYEARMVLHYSKPCKGTDTTVLVRGSGYAQTKGLAFTFDPRRVEPDTFNMYSCDTLVVPVYSSIVIDASVVDISLRVDFDTTQLRLVDFQSPVLARTCTSISGGIAYTPTLTHVPSPFGGRAVTCKNFCGVDSLTPFLYARFVTLNNNAANSPITVDSVNFDTEDVILYRLIATGDRGTIIARRSEIETRLAVAFDSVRILDCVDRQLIVHNIGDVTNTVDALLDLPAGVTIVGSVPALGDSVLPGDSAILTLRFCPREERPIDTNVVAVSAYPCETRDTTMVGGYGYAPEFDLTFAAMKTFWIPDSLGGAIGDTIHIPIMVEKDISATYQGIIYWLNGLNFSIDLDYNGRALKYLDADSLAQPNTTVTSPMPGVILIDVRSADTVRAGQLLRLRFLVTVPDSIRSTMAAVGGGFISDSLQFLDVVPKTMITPFVTTGSCNITVLEYTTVGAPAMRIVPNPAVSEATLQFRMQETVPVTAVIYNASGQPVRGLMDGSMTLRGGEYAVAFTTSDLPSGVYQIRLSAGIFTKTVPLVVVK